MTLRLFAATFTILMGWLTLTATCAYPQDDLIRDIIQTKVEQIRDYAPLKVGNATVASRTVLPDIYERNHFEPIWTDPEIIAAYLSQVAQTQSHGLRPSDYHFEELSQFHSALKYEATNPWLLTDRELLLTDSVIRLLYHLFFGKVDPVTMHAGWNFNRDLGDRNPAAIISTAIKSGTIGQLIDDLKPTAMYYQRLRTALGRYEEIRIRKQWSPVPSGPTITIGIRDQRVALLRKRLTITGDLRDLQHSNTEIFDQNLEQAVQRFQRRHGLEPDGVVDRITLNELNQPLDGLIDQIKANLERARWVLHDLPERFVVIDICGYMAHVFNAGAIEWSGRIQVGQPFRQTPTFKSVVKYLVINPFWTIPPGVLAQDIIPASEQTPRYFEENGICIYDGQGRQIDPASIDLKTYNTRSFKYRFVQRPGPQNPLGHIKFVLPNRYFIYLHDTIEKEAFNEQWRAFSSGCIRVENPLDLAAKLLNGTTRHDLATLRKQASSGRTQTIHLPEPAPVLLLYLTVYVDGEGMVFFREDVYQRDQDIIEGLGQPFEFKPRT